MLGAWIKHSLFLRHLVLSSEVVRCRSSARYLSSMEKIFVTRPDVPREAVDLLKEKYDVEEWNDTSISRNELLSKVKDKDGLYCFLTDTIDAELLDHAGPQLKVIGTMSVGYDHISVNECKKRNVVVGHTPGVLTDAMAELTVALLLATTRRLIEASQEVTNGGWKRSLWSPVYMCGSQIKGSVVGIIGFGRIGAAVAKILSAFQVKEILYNARSPKPEGSALGAKFATFDELIQTADIIICCCALTPETKNLLNDAAFDKMKSNAIFINTSRGAVVDQEALLNALKLGKIKAAGLDVTTPEPLPIDHPLTNFKNCVILPHIGSATMETRTEMALMTSRNIISALEGTTLPARLC